MTSSSTEHPNILLVILDTARADHFGPWGGRARTPVFDDLASRGTAVVNARSAAPWTVPSHASLFSGLTPREHGVNGPAATGGTLTSLRPTITANQDRWLPAVMGAAGYRTFGISANTWITEPMGFDLGFDSFRPVGPAKLRPRGGAQATRRPGFAQRMPAAIRAGVKKPVRALVTRPLRQVRDARQGRDFGSLDAVAALETFATRGTSPFFGFVNIMEPHAPYLPPRDCNPLRGLRRLAGPALVRRYLMDAHLIAYNAGAAEIPDEALATFRELYAGEIAYTDVFLGRMLTILEANGVIDDTLIVVTSDHGENLGEEHLVGHQASLDDRLLHVPLVFTGPGAREVPSDDLVFPMTGLPWLLARAAGVEGPWDAPGSVAVSQLVAGPIGRRLEAAAGRFDLTEARLERLRRSLDQATDGVTTLTMASDGTERIDGPASAVPALRAEIARARVAGRPTPQEGGSASAEELAEIEAHLTDLGYL